MAVFFSNSQHSQVQEPRGGNERASLTKTLSDSLANFLLPVPMTLCSVGLEVLVSEGGMLPPGDITMIPLKWMLRLPPSHFGLLAPQNQRREL